MNLFFRISVTAFPTYAHGGSSCSHFSNLFPTVVFNFLVYTMAAKFVSKLTFSPEDIAAPDHLEPAVESL